MKSNYPLKKIDKETAKLMNQIREKANKKSYGRKVTDTEIIGVVTGSLKFRQFPT